MQVTELLYLKQTQLEQMAGEKAAQALQLERELAAARADAERARRREVDDPARFRTSCLSGSHEHWTLDSKVSPASRH